MKIPNKTLCYGCKERISVCHSTCSRYIAWREKLDEFNKITRIEKEARWQIEGYRTEKMGIRIKKRK
jgi:hypothetical protein